MENEGVNGAVSVLDMVQAENHLEKVMQHLNPNRTVSERRLMMGAVIDTMQDFGHITEATRNALYPKYCN